jgi:sulfofructose kinase
MVCLGIAVQDMIFGLSELPVTEGKYRAHAFASAGGGMAASAAAAIGRLGCPVELWTRLGDDVLGDAIVAELKTFGVDVRWCKRAAGQNSPVSAVLVDGQGERLLVNYSDPDSDMDTSWLPVQRIADSAAVLVDTRWELGAIAVLDAARAAGIPAVLDADSPPVSHDVLQRATHCVFSHHALYQCTHTEDVVAGLRLVAGLTGGVVAVTLGAGGVSWLADGETHHQPAFQVEAVDTLGAGDVFHGALAVALSEAMALPDAMRFAAAAAALKCMRFGGRRGAPTRAEVMALLDC